MRKTILLSFAALISIEGFSQCWEKISCGGYSTGLINSNGTLWTCGLNDSGQLGLGSLVNINFLSQVGLDNNWRQVSTSNHHSVAIKDDGSLWAWGGNGNGQLGDGTNLNSNIPKKIGSLSDWSNVLAGSLFTIALKTDGSLWAWGNNDEGQFGNGTTIGSNLPVQIGTDNNWKSISVGSPAYVLALKNDNSLWAWGSNFYGQLGDGTNISKLIPTKIGIEKDWKIISAGEGIPCSHAIKLNGSLWGWGGNGNGQVGDGTNIHKNSPINIGIDTNWKSVQSGFVRCFALKTNGTLWAWGLNNMGQLGDGSLTSYNVPKQIGIKTNWNILATAANHTIANDSENRTYTWGSNNYGQLGDTTNIDKIKPKIIFCNPTFIFETTTINTINQLFPNPFSTSATLEFDNPQGKPHQLSVFNALGQLVIQIENIKSNKLAIDRKELQNGFYFYQLRNEEGIAGSGKIVIE